MLPSERRFWFLVVALVVSFGAWIEFSFLRLDHLPQCPGPWQQYSIHLEWDGHRPLNVVFLTWGSRGDHQPNIALGLELARRRHNVTILGMTKYRHLIEQHAALKYGPFNDSMLWELAKRSHHSKGVELISLASWYVGASAEEIVPQYLEAAKGADLLIGQHSPLSILHHMTVAHALNKPLVLMTHDLTLPTEQHSFDPVHGRVQDYGKRTNVLNHRLFAIIFGLFLEFSTTWRAYRSSLGLTTPWPLGRLLSPESTVDFPVISTPNPVLWSPPRDHPMHWTATGFLETKDDFIHPETHELQEWIENRKHMNRSIVYFGQGSFYFHNRTMFADIFLDALEKLEMDGVALHSTVDNRTMPEYLKVVTEAIHTVLFPQCAAIVHHGGAGTSSQCISSARPGICIPSMPVQQVWCGQLEDFGVGMVVLRGPLMAAWKKNRTNLLVDAIQRVTSAEVLENARKLARKTLSATGGVELAADMVLLHMEKATASKQNSPNHPGPTEL